MKSNELLNIAREEGVAEMVNDIGQHIANQRKRHGPDPEFDLMIMGAFINIVTKIAYAKKDKHMLGLMISAMQGHEKKLLAVLK